MADSSVPTQPSAADAAAAASVPSTDASSSTAQKSKKDKKQKPSNPNVVIPPKKLKKTKAERRAEQDAQRAAKAAKQGGAGGGKVAAAAPSKGGFDVKVAAAATQQAKRGKSKKGTAAEDRHQPDAAAEGSSSYARRVDDDKTLSLFSHLPPYRDPKLFEEYFSGVALGSGDTRLHPAVLSLGLNYASGTIRGGNARARSMLRAFQSVIRDYTVPPGKDLRQDLDHRILKPAFQHWTSKCRPHSVSMGNAFTFLKLAVAALDRDIDVNDAKEVLCESMDAYVQERIDFADKAISRHASPKISDGDVILTYASSEVVEVLLREAHERARKAFRVIVADSRPLLEGKGLVRRLASSGIECSYVLLNSLSYVMMREVTKVFLGASALMSDGSVLSRVGTACVALSARSANVPVLFCCETYKISSRVQLESITGNELGDPDGVVSTTCTDVMAGTENVPGRPCSVLEDWQSVPDLRVLNLLYDLTPSEFVSGIVTEMGILPPTSVAVLLREMNPQDNDSAFKS